MYGSIKAKVHKIARHVLMKKKKLTGITLMLATAVVSTAVGGVLLSKINVSADEETATTTAKTYALSSVFNGTNAGIGASDAKVAQFTLSDAGSVTYKNDLALNWYEANDQGEAEEKFFNVKFAFADVNFKEITLSMDAASAWATKEDLSTNTVTFKNDSGALGVYVNDEKTAATTIAAADAKKALSLRFAESAVDGEFKVQYAIENGEYNELGVFENIGANYAEYSNTTDDESFPLTFEASITTADAKTSVLLYELNGQSFENVDGNNEVEDTAEPVLVVNEELGGFLLGTAVTLDYKVIDVLNTKNLTTPVLGFYQWTPANENAPQFKLDDSNAFAEDSDYKKLTTSSTYLMDTVYYVKDGNVVAADTEGATATSVYKENKNEYVSILVQIGDGTFKDVKCDLSWYASEAAKVTKDGQGYILVNKNEEGPTYNTDYVKEDTAFDADAYAEDTVWKDFQEALAAAAKDVVAGSNSTIRFPSFKWLINDNNGYRNLKFTISYKTPSSTSASTSSSLSYNALKLSVSTAGLYEFKIFAVDKAGNAMQCKDMENDNELVDVTSSNIWDLEQIPSFTFEIKNGTLEVDEPTKATDKKDTVSLDTTYTLSDIDVIGANSLKEDYALFKVNLDAYNATAESGKLLSQSALTAISYEDLAKQITEDKIKAADDYFELYITAYAEVLAKEVGTTADKIKPCFTQIKEYDSRITEDNDAEAWNAYNKYNWSPSSQNFKTAEEGTYLILADYYEEEIYTQRATAYQLVVVESEADVIEGETQWLKNNMVSVILFSVAGVMLILIIILLLVKPSDETLEDVDVKAAKKTEKKTKKSKKE